jgi:hypothetical protein
MRHDADAVMIAGNGLCVDLEFPLERRSHLRTAKSRSTSYLCPEGSHACEASRIGIAVPLHPATLN